MSRVLERDLHPGAWWLWALSMATAASRTTNPLLLAVALAAVGVVVTERRGDAPWAKGFRAYLILGLVVVAIRVMFRMLLDGQYGDHVLFTLPELSLPEAAAGIRIGGPVSLEGILAAVYDGLRLATLLICLGAANVLANPKRLLRSVPSALYEIGVAVTVALTVAPQLVESGRRVTRARRLRGDIGRRTRWFRQIVVPVMTDALDRSLLLAAAMDSKGYGRTTEVRAGTRRLTGVLLISGMCGICIGAYGLLDATTPRVMGLPMLFGGVALAVAGFMATGRRILRSRYRPDPWLFPEWSVVASGVIVAAIMFLYSSKDPAGLNPTVQPLRWPTLPLVPTLGILVGALPAWLAPPPLRGQAESGSGAADAVVDRGTPRDSSGLAEVSA
ncbi:MAG: CbiQ family ECF transporter T component [Microthrixaceae bacterium]